MKTQLQLALKVLARRKAFTAISLFGISVTLAVLMVATAILDHLFQPRPPETNLDRTLVVTQVGQYGPESGMTSPPGYALLDRFVRTLPDIERAAIYTPLQSAAVYRNGERIDVMARRTDGEYWNMLDYRFLEGGPYSVEDDASGRLVAVINDDVRKKLFDGRAAVGRTFELEGRTFRVVGVVPRTSLTQQIAYAQVWMPIGSLKSSDYRDKYLGDFTGAVVVRDGSAIPAVQREFQNRLPSVPLHDPKKFQETRGGLDTPFESFVRMMAGNRQYDPATTPRTFRIVIGVLALLFMALPALNLVTLNLSRILERAPEIGVRRSFGAPRSALVRQFIFENVVVTVIGGVIGFALAGLFLPILNRLAPLPDANLALNPRVFAWGMVLAVLFGLLSGVYPAWAMSRLHPVNALRGGSK